LFSRKFVKTVQDAEHFKNGGHQCAEHQHKNFTPEKGKSNMLLFLVLYICVKGIGKLSKPKTRIPQPNSNPQHVFKNHQYFGAFFQDMFFLQYAV